MRKSFVLLVTAMLSLFLVSCLKEKPIDVEVEKVIISGSISGVVGDEIILSAEILPENATVKDITWSTNDPILATVNDGKVMLLSPGEVTITAKCGEKEDQHVITISPKIIETTKISIEGLNEGEIGDIIDLVAEVIPADATNNQVSWKSSDESLATVNDGRVNLLSAGIVVITAYQGDIQVTHEIKINLPPILADDIIIEADAIDGIVGDEIRIIGRIQPTNATSQEIIWSSSDSDIAVVENGVVILKGVGEVVITANQKDISKDYTINVYEDLDYLWLKFVESRNAEVSRQNIVHYGNSAVTVAAYRSIFNYAFNDPMTINKTHWLPTSHPAHPNKTMTSIEYIVIHDTGNINSDAEANAKFQVSEGNTSVSWAYTVGGDGWFQTMDDDQVSWHSSAGSSTTAFTDTGIPAVNPSERTRMTIVDGYFAIKGIKTNVKAPAKEFNIVGQWPVIINGTYWIPDTSERNGIVGLDGGNYNAIGIETSVVSTGDVWLTWHRTARLVAHLLLKHDLSLDRVVYHNSFNNKVCPQTAIRSGNVENWYELIKFEYMLMKKFADYEITLTVLPTTSAGVLTSKGRIRGLPKVGDIFEYTLKITAPNGEYKEETFKTTIIQRVEE